MKIFTLVVVCIGAALSGALLFGLLAAFFNFNAAAIAAAVAVGAVLGLAQLYFVPKEKLFKVEITND